MNSHNFKSANCNSKSESHETKIKIGVKKSNLAITENKFLKKDQLLNG